MNAPEKFDDQLLLDYMNGFFGYGNYDADYWFVGMEEGGGGYFQDVQNKVTDWSRRGKRELEDLIEYHAAIGVTYFFGENGRIQPTWNKLIRILLSAEGHDISRESVRQYQKSSLARAKGNSCLLELLPLPSPSAQHWFYAEYSNLPHLQNREVYRNHYAESRAKHIRQRITEYRPKAVVFYSVNWWYVEWWKKIAGVSFTAVEIGKHRASMGRDEHTSFIITKHPVARGIRSEYFHEIGRLIADTN